MGGEPSSHSNGALTSPGGNTGVMTDPDRAAPEASPPTEKQTPAWAHIAGWYGTLAILWAFYASSHNHLEQGATYQLLNLSGAIGVATVCWYQRTWPALALEVAWAGIAVSALWHII